MARVDHDSCCVFLYDQNPVPTQQSSAEPCSAKLSQWGNPFSYLPNTPKGGTGTGIRTHNTKHSTTITNHCATGASPPDSSRLFPSSLEFC